MNGPELLKRWRTSVRNLSQDAAAKLVDVHQNTWSDWENGNKTPRIELAIKLHLLTEGECPVESWASDEQVREQFRAATGTDGR